MMIKKALMQKANEIEAKEVLWSQIQARIYEEEQTMMNNKKFSLKTRKKWMTIAASCMAVASLTVIAGTIGKAWMGQSTLRYNSFPEEAVVQKDAGFMPKYVESLPGGFEFFKGYTGDERLVDEGQAPLVEGKSFSATYRQVETHDLVTMSAEQIPQNYMQFGSNTQEVGSYDGKALYYTEQVYKFVPSNYEATEEDMQATENNELVLSYGDNGISVENVQSLQWYDGDALYTLTANDVNLSVEALMEMAETIIEDTVE